MKAIFIGTSKHYKTGKEYNIKSKLAEAMDTDNNFGVKHIIAVYNIDDESARYKFEKSKIVYVEDNKATSPQPYRTYTTIEEFLKDWKVVENE